MRLKSELYHKEQIQIMKQIINILELDNDNSFILYELDNDSLKINKILELIPNIRKYFTYRNIEGAKNPEKLKRPYLSIIRHITKLKYNMLSCDYLIKKDSQKIRTKKIIFLKK